MVVTVEKIIRKKGYNRLITIFVLLIFSIVIGSTVYEQTHSRSCQLVKLNSSNRKTEKYGVWYSSQIGVYHGPMATYPAGQRPIAIYDSSKNRTFFVYGNADNNPTISYYDHNSKSFITPVEVGKNINKDAHRTPSLLVDEEGYIYVFYGSHRSVTNIKKSRYPYEISEWEPGADIEGFTTYPEPWQLKSEEIIVLYRNSLSDKHAKISYKKSLNGALSWGDSVDLIDFSEESIYKISIAETGGYPRKIHLVWTSMQNYDWKARYNLYYAYSDDGGLTWKKRDGIRYKLPITKNSAEKIYDSKNMGIWLQDVQLDSRGNPYALFIEANTDTYKSSWKFISYSDNHWRTSDITTSDHMYDHGSLVIIKDNDFRVYAPTTPSQIDEDGGEIEEWRSADSGKTWVNTKHVTSNSNYSHNYTKTVFNHRNGDFLIFWSYGDSSENASDKSVFLYYYGERQGRGKPIFCF